MRKWNHVCSLLVFVISVITPGRQRSLTAFRRYYLLKNKLSDRMTKQLLNSVIAKYRHLSVSRRSIIFLSLRLRQIIGLLATDKSRYFAQPRPIIANLSIDANFSSFSLAESPPCDLQITAYKKGLLTCNVVQLCLAFTGEKCLIGRRATMWYCQIQNGGNTSIVCLFQWKEG